MKYFTLIPAVLFSLTSVNALASNYTCKAINGHIAQLTPDPACNILKSKPKHFPEETFLAELGIQNTCFSTVLTATLGIDNTPVNGTAYSGLTQNSLNPSIALTAVSFTQLYLDAGNIKLGGIYTKDVMTDPQGNTIESLAMVDGRRTFNGGRGSLIISGNTLSGATSFSGTLCIEN